MADLDPSLLYNPKTPFAISISHGAHPKTLEDLDASHKDPTYELVSGTREAYFIKKLAGILAHKVAQSDDVRNIASLVQDAARELERSWRMASCISNVPVSTGYPYLPTMPTGPSGGESLPASDKSVESTSTGSAAAQTAKVDLQLKKASMISDISILARDPIYGRIAFRRRLGTFL